LFATKSTGREVDDSHDDTGISKGIVVSFLYGGRTFRLYGVHLASEAGPADADESADRPGFDHPPRDAAHDKCRRPVRHCRGRS
jgi:hypothetical protein